MMFRRLTVTQSLSAVFVVLLLACSAVSAWLQIHASTRHEQEVVQRVSYDLAGHIADTAQLMDARGWRPQAVHRLFDQLMAVNPSVELYLLDRQGAIVGDAAPAGGLKRQRVNLAPIEQFLAGGALPILGDDPRSARGRKVFSAARVTVEGRDAGFVYAVLQGQAHDVVARARSTDRTLWLSLLLLGFVALLALVMGLIAFHLITRPLKQLTQSVRRFEADGQLRAVSADALSARPAALQQAPVAPKGNEVAILREAFEQMRGRIGEQWRELSRQDQQRRDLIANISHDLRTPLTSLHGYLETLRVKNDKLDAAQRRQFLDIALAQSGKVRHLAQELFELARLESGLVKAEPEAFALTDLLQDVVQKCALTAQARGQTISVDRAGPLPAVRADVGMVERVLTNLLDNAIRHNPPGTHIEVSPAAGRNGVQIEVKDDGPGIPAAQRSALFVHVPALRRVGGESGGFGLIVVRRLLQLNHGDIELVDTAGGTTFRFHLPVA